MKASVETHILRILLVCILLLVGLILWVNLSPHLPDTTSVDVQSESYVIMRFEDGEVLSSKEKDAQIYPASMTKMMTAILAIENYEDHLALDSNRESESHIEISSTAYFCRQDANAVKPRPI